MATMFEEYTIEERRSLVRILWGSELNARDIHKEMSLVNIEKYLSRKSVRKSQMMPDQVRQWLRQQSKTGKALIKRWDKCISVGGGYVEKLMFFSGSTVTCFSLYIFL
jgi:hypothetical protein